MARRARPAHPAEVLADADQLRAIVERLAAEITADHPEGVHLVVVLKGAVHLAADLARLLPIPVTVDLVAIAPFVAGERARFLVPPSVSLDGRAVVVVEDLVDTGLSLSWLLAQLGAGSPAAVEVCTLLDKPARRIIPVPLRYVGLVVPDRVVLGYGLDYAGRYRNLPLLALARAEDLAAEPDRHLAQLYDPRLR